jgi:hypothetical protein
MDYATAASREDLLRQVDPDGHREARLRIARAELERVRNRELWNEIETRSKIPEISPMLLNEVQQWIGKNRDLKKGCSLKCRRRQEGPSF